MAVEILHGFARAHGRVLPVNADVEPVGVLGDAQILSFQRDAFVTGFDEVVDYRNQNRVTDPGDEDRAVSRFLHAFQLHRISGGRFKLAAADFDDSLVELFVNGINRDQCTVWFLQTIRAGIFIQGVGGDAHTRTALVRMARFDQEMIVA